MRLAAQMLQNSTVVLFFAKASPSAQQSNYGIFIGQPAAQHPSH
jgi:hypothetical protein